MFERHLSAAVFITATAIFGTAQAQSVAKSGEEGVVCRRGSEVVSDDECLQILSRRLHASRRFAPRLAADALAAAGKNTGKSDKKTAKKDGEESNLKIFPVLRRTMDDVGSFASPNDPADSAGAEFSWARNGISGNHALTAKGVVALSLVWQTDKPLRNQPYLNTVTFAPYAVFDRLRNDIDTNKNIDDLAFGATGELGYANFMHATHYLRFKGEVASSFDGGKAKNWAMAAEYQPFGNYEQTGMGSLFNYLNTPIGVPGIPSAFFSIGPKLVTEYRTALEDDSDPIFSTRKAALRSGPTVIFGFGMDNIFEKTPTVIQSAYYQLTWGWLWDWLSQRDYQLIDTSLTFNIDPESHLGFTISHTYGDVVATGKRANVTKAGLSAKF